MARVRVSERSIAHCPYLVLPRLIASASWHYLRGALTCLGMSPFASFVRRTSTSSRSSRSMASDLLVCTKVAAELRYSNSTDYPLYPETGRDAAKVYLRPKRCLLGFIRQPLVSRVVVQIFRGTHLGMHASERFRSQCQVRTETGTFRGKLTSVRQTREPPQPFEHPYHCEWKKVGKWLPCKH